MAPNPAASCPSPAPPADPVGPNVTLPLSHLAYARAGDKGGSSNVAIIARSSQYFALLRREVTPGRVLAHLVAGPAESFEAPGLGGVNFLIANALGGGGMAPLRIDPQGKAYGQMVLGMPIEVPPAGPRVLKWPNLKCARAGVDSWLLSSWSVICTFKGASLNTDLGRPKGHAASNDQQQV